MDTLYESWVWKTLVIGRSLLSTGFTWSFSNIFMDFSDKQLTKMFNVNNETIYTYNYSFGKLDIILMIPAVLFGFLLTFVILSFLINTRCNYNILFIASEIAKSIVVSNKVCCDELHPNC